MSVYERGHKCDIYGVKLGSYESFSMRNVNGKEVYYCNDCDIAMYVPQKTKEE